MAKRGKLEVFDYFEPDKTDLLVIDMQCAPSAIVGQTEGFVPAQSKYDRVEIWQNPRAS